MPPLKHVEIFLATILVVCVHPPCYEYCTYGEFAVGKLFPGGVLSINDTILTFNAINSTPLATSIAWRTRCGETLPRGCAAYY